MLIALRRHPMCRRSDRVEAMTLLSVAVLFLLAVPIAVVVGRSVFSSSMVTVHREQNDRHRVVATVVARSVDLPIKITGLASEVTATWRGPRGERIRDVIPVVGAPAVGSHLVVWAASDGRPVAAPFTRSQAEAQADAVGIAVAAGLLGMTYVMLVVVRRSLLRRRVRAWDAEWMEAGAKPRT